MNTPAPAKKSPPSALAILRDSRRRGGWRVCRVAVTHVVSDLSAAEVEEQQMTKRVPHWVPFARLSSKGPRDLAAKFRTIFSPAPEEAESAVVSPLAGQTGAGEAPPHWTERD